ncbi:MAG: hypothetical protein AB7O24_16035 [Kofleriaceae bacterium]
MAPSLANQRLLRFVLCLFAGITACSPSPREDVSTLAIEPADHVYYVEGNSPPRVAYRATVAEPGGPRDVTDEVEWHTLDPELLTFEDAFAVPSTARGGTTRVEATLGDVVASTSATIVQQRSIVDPELPSNIPAVFDAAAVDPLAPIPELVYPSEPALVPRNFAGLEFQWRSGAPPAPLDVFEVAIETTNVRLRHYLTCDHVEDGCVFTTDAASWTLIAELFAGQETRWTVSRLSLAHPERKAKSSSRALILTASDLTAVLYYWNAREGSIDRFDFGNASAAPEQWLPGNTAAGCYGCHALSRDGALAAVSRNSPGRVSLIDVATGSVKWTRETPEWRYFTAFSPDGRFVLLNDYVSLTVADVNTGADVGFGTLAQGALFPDWSADGTMIAYTQPPPPSGLNNYDATQSDIVVRRFDGSTFAPPQTVVQFDGVTNNYYPAFLPDSRWLVFNRAPAVGIAYGSSYNNPAAALWAVAASGAGEPRPLANANGGYEGNSWPKVAPVQLGYSAGLVSIVAFSSPRPIGLRPGGVPQLWIAGVDTARSDLDPSFAALHLPWQGASRNHVAQWAAEIPPIIE